MSVVNISNFNIRVYGILVNPMNEVLLVQEKIGNLDYVKFPGGGLEFGEGTAQCICREFEEETGQQVSIMHHIYTTDFFVQSAFKQTDQIISLYYRVHCKTWDQIPKQRAVQMPGMRAEFFNFFWLPLTEIKAELLSFPVDKFLVNNYLNKI